MPQTAKKPAAAIAPLFDRPFALSIGPQRVGTTWLDFYLRARGDVCMPAGVKEIFFFDRAYMRGLDFYKNHFRPEENHKLLMEVSTTSFDNPEAPMRVYETFGKNLRLLCPLRAPVPRSYSLYRHYLRYGIVKGTLQQACTQYPQILTSSHYAQHLQRWLDIFGRDSIHIVFQEDMESAQGSFITQICNALQIPVMMPRADINKRYNVSAYSPFPRLAKWAHNCANLLRSGKLYPIINAAKKIGLKRLILGLEKPDAGTSIPPADRAWLETQLAGQVEALENLIGPISQWR